MRADPHVCVGSAFNEIVVGRPVQVEDICRIQLEVCYSRARRQNGVAGFVGYSGRIVPVRRRNDLRDRLHHEPCHSPDAGGDEGPTPIKRGIGCSARDVLAVCQPGSAQRIHVARVIEIAAHVRLKRKQFSVVEHEGEPPAHLSGQALIVLANAARNRDRGHVETKITAKQRRARNVIVFDQRQHDGEEVVVVCCSQALEEIAGDREPASAAQRLDKQVVVEPVGIAEAITLQIARVRG